MTDQYLAAVYERDRKSMNQFLACVFIALGMEIVWQSRQLREMLKKGKNGQS